MALLAAEKIRLANLGLPSDVEMIRRVRSFELRSGLTHGELSDMAGLNPNSFRVWISGSYGLHVNKDSNTLSIRAALKALMDRHELAEPVMADCTHYDTAEYAAVRKSMLAALAQGTAFLVDGPPGTQKTYTFRRVAEEINRSGAGSAVYVYSRVDHSPQAFLVEACTEAGIPNRGTIDQLVRKLRFFLGSKQRSLLIVDEGQHLPMATLEILRQLLDTPPYFGVVLGGSHDLSIRLRGWQMEQWRSRLRRTHLLKGLSAAEAANILTAEFGPLPDAFIAQSVTDATVTAVRGKAPFEYISARNLFFAIEDTRKALDGELAAEDETTLKEALA